MAKKVQLTLTGNEGKVLIAKAAAKLPQVQECLACARLLLAGGTTVSAFSEELGYGPLRISGRIDASGTRTALNIMPTPHNLLIQKGQAINVDKNIQEVVESLNNQDLIVIGANAIDTQGRAALAFAAMGGGSRGFALHSAYMQGVPMLILCGLNKLIPDLGSAMAHSGRTSIDMAMGAAIGLYNLYGPIITEIKAFEILFGVEAVVIAGSGIGNGEGSRTFVLYGEEEAIMESWKQVQAIKGAPLSGDQGSLPVCHGGCVHCKRHVGCMYKYASMPECQNSFWS
ncbi:MAG: hypothetical protein ACOX4H_07125 [Bacillota bacterium]